VEMENVLAQLASLTKFQLPRIMKERDRTARRNEEKKFYNSRSPSFSLIIDQSKRTRKDETRRNNSPIIKLPTNRIPRSYDVPRTPNSSRNSQRRVSSSFSPYPPTIVQYFSLSPFQLVSETLFPGLTHHSHYQTANITRPGNNMRRIKRRGSGRGMHGVSDDEKFQTVPKEVGFFN
jgi:hypothetical protein